MVSPSGRGVARPLSRLRARPPSGQRESCRAGASLTPEEAVWQRHSDRLGGGLGLAPQCRGPGGVRRAGRRGRDGRPRRTATAPSASLRRTASSRCETAAGWSPSVAASSPSESDADPVQKLAASHRHDAVAVGQQAGIAPPPPRTRRRTGRPARRARSLCRATWRRAARSPGRPRPRSISRRAWSRSPVDDGPEREHRPPGGAGAESARRATGSRRQSSSVSRPRADCGWPNAGSRRATRRWRRARRRPMRAPSSDSRRASSSRSASSASVARHSGTYQS